MAQEHIPIKLMFAVMLLNILMVSYVSSANGRAKGKLTKPDGAGGKKVILNGATAESTHLPMQLKCDASDRGILVGSITIDSKQVHSALLESARKECNTTKKLLKTGPSSQRLRCELVLAGEKSLTGKEHIRVVYQCYRYTPSGWGEDKVKTAKPNREGKVNFKCSNAKSLVEVVKILQEGKEIETNLQKYRGLVKRVCYLQSAKAVSKGSTDRLNCLVQLDHEDAYKLEVQYRCENPPV